MAKAKAVRAGFYEKEKSRKSLTLAAVIESYIKDNSHILSPATIRGYNIILMRCNPNTPTSQINSICEKNDLPKVGLHGLRRSFASLAHHLGWDVRTTMRYGGWSDYKTMNDFYIKLDETDLLKDAEKMRDFYRE